MLDEASFLDPDTDISHDSGRWPGIKEIIITFNDCDSSRYLTGGGYFSPG